MIELLRPGADSFAFEDIAGANRREVRVHFWCPREDIRNAPVVIAMHGVDRAAEAFRDVLVKQAERNGQIILVPEFDLQQFPDVFAYNFGGVRLPPPANDVPPRAQWNFGIVDRLFLRVRDALRSNQRTFGMFGNSAGAQFVLRYLALNVAPFVETAVASNCGVYMLPDLALAYPNGMGGLDVGEQDLRRYLGRRLTILLGDADTEVAAHDLPRNEFAMAQGPHRLARGHWHFDHCTRVAGRLGMELGWQLEIVRGAGHVSQRIYDRAAGVLKE